MDKQRLHNRSSSGVHVEKVILTFQSKREKALELVKGATKIYFRHYSCMGIIFFIADLYKSTFSTYPFRKTSFLFFCVLCLLSVLFYTRSHLYRFFITFLLLLFIILLSFIRENMLPERL